MDPYASLRFRNFRLFISARFLLTFSIQIQNIILGWEIYRITHDPLSLGLIGLAEAIPSFSVALFAGHFADKYNKKKIILSGITAVIICMGFLGFIFYNSAQFSEKFITYTAYFAILITGLARGILGPTFFAFLSQLVPREQYPNASTWNGTFWQTASVAGPAAGGFIMGLWGPGKGYFIICTCTLVCLCIMWFIKPDMKLSGKTNVSENIRTSILTGLNFVRSNDLIFGALLLDLLAVLFGGAVALLPAFAKDILKTGPEGLGILRAAPSVGAAISMVFLIYFPPMKNTGKKLFIAVAGFGFCMILFSISTSFYLSVIILALSGAFDSVSVIIRSTILQLMTPEEMRGRVSSINTIFIGSSNEIGAFESGVAAKLIGLIPSVFAGGTITLGISYFMSRKYKTLWQLSLSEKIN